MQYGHFDNQAREYVIDRVDLPVSWTNYIGLGDMLGVFNHTAGGYLLYKSPEYHRITRFRANSVPTDTPGHYVYLRDEESGVAMQSQFKVLDISDGAEAGPVQRQDSHQIVDRHFGLAGIVESQIAAERRARGRQVGNLGRLRA